MARIAQERDPRKVRIVYEKHRWLDIWDNNPRIARRDDPADCQELVPRIGWKRPYIADKTPTKWTWQRWPEEWGGTAPRGEIYFTDAEREFGAQHAGLVIIEPRLKPSASPMKDWGWKRWVRLAGILRAAGITVHQVGDKRYPFIEGVETIKTETIRKAAAIIERARLVITHEGALHHVAAAVGTPAIVLFGGYISDKVTGYPEQVSLFTGGPEHPLGCGMRVPCKHCERAMAAITPEDVAARAVEILMRSA